MGIRQNKAVNKSKTQELKNHKPNRFNNKGNDEGCTSKPRIEFKDVSLYSLGPNVDKAIGNLPFNVLAGQPILIDLSTNHSLGGFNTSNVLSTSPAILAIRYVPTIGSTRSLAKSKNITSDYSYFNDSVNIASRALYSYVRHQNSGSANYNSPDLMLYELAMGEVFRQYFEARRIYAAAVTYSKLNTAIPDALTTALGVDGDDIRANLAQFRSDLNVFARKVSRLAVPNTFKIFRKIAEVATKVYMDTDTIRGQMYVFVSDGYFKYSPTTSQTGGMLEWKVRTNWNRNHTQVMSELDDALNALLPDEDINIMSGDLIKAYGQGNMFLIPEVGDEEVLELVKDEHILSMIENSYSLGRLDKTHTNGKTNLDIQQDRNNLFQYTLQFPPDGGPIPYYTGSRNGIFNSHKDEMDPLEVIEATDLRSVVLGNDYGSNYGVPIQACDMYIQEYIIYISQYVPGGLSSDRNIEQMSFVSSFECNIYNTTTPGSTLNSYLRVLCALSAFDWHPIIYLQSFSGTTSDQTRKSIGYFGDLRTATTVTQGFLQARHNAAATALLAGDLLQK